jgi:flagellar motility protein MotE (MotC chaperone)
MNEKKMIKNRRGSMMRGLFFTRFRLSRLALGLALLAGVKAAVLLATGPGVSSAAFLMPVRSALLDDSPALAQDASRAAPSGSVLTAQQLQARSEALDRKEQALKTMEDGLNARLAQLKQLETTLTGMLAEAKSIKEERMVHLISLYTNMKPKQAGAALEALDENTAVKILAGMKGRQAGDILNNVSPKKAASLSDALTKFQIGPDLPQKP